MEGRSVGSVRPSRDGWTLGTRELSRQARVLMSDGWPAPYAERLAAAGAGELGLGMCLQLRTAVPYRIVRRDPGDEIQPGLS